MRYYFDIRDGDHISRDEIGVELRNIDAAHTEAAVALTEMARDYLPSDGPHRVLGIHVRDFSGKRFKVTIDYDVEEQGAAAPATAA